MTDLFEQDEGDFNWETMSSSADTTTADQPDHPDPPAPPDPEDAVDTSPEVPAELAEPLAAATADPVEERQRDGQGRFLPKFKDPDVNGFLDKYNGNVEEALRAAVNSQRLLGSQGGEIGELRRQLEQVQATQTRLAEPAVDYNALIEENPARATMLAYERGDEYAYREAVQQWEAMSPGAPQLWAQNLQLGQELHKLSQRFDETTGPLKEQAQTQGFAAAFQSLVNDNPDAQELGSEMGQALQALGQTTQAAILSTLKEGTPEGQKEVLHTLYTIARGLKSDTLAKQGQDAAQQHVAETQRAKDDAILASASASKVETPLTAGQKIGNEWDALISPLESGWNIGSL